VRIYQSREWSGSCSFSGGVEIDLADGDSKLGGAALAVCRVQPDAINRVFGSVR
jgi:hypothetical protein